MQVVLNVLNNFLLITEGDFLWLKWSNYALKLQNGKTQVCDDIKNMNNSTNTQPILMKIYMQVVSNLLNNFLLIMKGDFLWLKLSNYALNLWNGKEVSIIMKDENNSRSIDFTFIKIDILVVFDLLNSFQLVIELIYLDQNTWNACWSTCKQIKIFVYNLH